MGNPIEPTDPEWQGCPDCCENLPETLNGRLTVPGVGVFEGAVNRLPLHPCRFEGVLRLGEQSTPLYVTFCADDTNDTLIATHGPIQVKCGGVRIDDNNCYPGMSKVSGGGCLYQVWP